MEQRDPYQIWDGKKFRFTLRKLCSIIYEGEKYHELPDGLKPLADKPVTRVMANSMPEKKGLRVTFDLSWRMTPEESAEHMTELLGNGVVVVTNRRFTAPGGTEYPVIAVDDPWEAWVKLGRYVKGVFPMPTVAITGSVGKTTTTEFARCVFDERYRTFVSGLDGANYNSPLQIVNQWMLRAGPEYTFHVQECGAETPRLVEYAARIVDADAFAITNIDTTQHIAAYGTPECLIADKTSFDRVRKEDTFAVINLDDEILRDFPFQSPCVTFAVKDERADFVGKNIVQNGELLEFDVVHAGGTAHICIHIFGAHNVYNGLVVFALAKKFGLTDEEIQRGFLRYRAVGIRQNLRRVAGRLLYMDCYNASVESTQSSVHTLEDMELEPGARRIAVIGERATTNEETYQINYELGQSLAGFGKIDELIIVGEDAERITGHIDEVGAAFADRYRSAMYTGAKSVLGDIPRLTWCDDLAKLADRLRYQTQAGDAILFKGRYHLSLWAVADMAFGTAYTKSPAVFPLGVTKEAISQPPLYGVDYAVLNGVELTRVSNGIDNTKLVLPDSLCGRSIVRVGNGAFAFKSQLKHVVFGENIQSIGDRAFQNCRNLERAGLPKDCLYIGACAFENCTVLVQASLPGVLHISAGAFRGCANLREVFLTERCASIEDGAFDGCGKLTFLAPEGSYAALWAAAHNMALETLDSMAELEKLARNGTRLRREIYALPPFGGSVPPLIRTRGRLTVTVAGDIMAHTELLESSRDASAGAYDFRRLFAHTERYIRGADVAIGNLETVLGHGAYTGFPVFNSPDELAEAMSAAGFDIVACANNHILDGGLSGILRTEHVLRSLDLAVAGIRSNREKRAWAMVERSGVKIAVVNFTYLSSALDGKVMNNRHPVDGIVDGLINTFCFETLDTDLEKVGAEISCARNDGADIVLVYYHWGSEYAAQADTLQQFIAQRTAELGADVILGSHAHVPQKMGCASVRTESGTRAVPVFYGLGNYCWSARQSRTGRELVQCGVLAQLDIGFDRMTRRVTDIQVDYVPLYIKLDYIDDRWDVNVLPLKDLTAEDIAAFERCNSLPSAAILESIDGALHGGGTPAVSTRFDRIPELAVGEKIGAVGTVLSANEVFSSIRSENAPVASVLQNGTVIGNAPGFAGIVTVMPDGSEIRFVVKVVNRRIDSLPVPADEYNAIPDIYLPDDLCSGSRYGLTRNNALRSPAAKAWHIMQLAAEQDGVYLNCISGYRSTEEQLRKIIACREAADRGNELPPAAPVGCSEHQLGLALDVTGGDHEDSETTVEEASAWLEKNAALFGFILRPYAGEEYRHLRYLGSNSLANVLQAENACIRDYLERYHHFRTELDRIEGWRSRYLTEEEKAQSQDRWDKLTLGRICTLAGLEEPEAWWAELDRIVPSITLTDVAVEPGSVIFYDKGVSNARHKCRSAIRKGAALIVTDTPIANIYGDMPPQMSITDSSEAWMKVAMHIRKLYRGRMIGIAEKGVHHELRNALSSALTDRFDVQKSTAARDSRLNVLEMIQQLPGRDGVCLQNLPQYGAKMAEVMQPDIAVFSGLPDSTPQNFSSCDAYWQDQLTLLDRTLERGGTVFINGDEPRLQSYVHKENAVTFGAGAGVDFCLKDLWASGKTWMLSVAVKGQTEPILWLTERSRTQAINAVDVLAVLGACVTANYLAPGSVTAATAPTGRRYKFTAGCELRRGWWEENGNRYYLSEQDGHVLEGGLFRAGGQTYYAGPDGALYMGGFFQVRNKTYYAGPDGMLHVGWLEEDGKRYYFSEQDAHLLKGGRFRVDGQTYFAGPDGAIQMGFVDDGGKIFYFDPAEGHMLKNRLIRVNGRRYYLAKDGQRLSGCTVSDKEGRRYRLSADDGHVVLITGRVAAKLKRKLQGEVLKKR